jgi:hypothetical protein
MVGADGFMVIFSSGATVTVTSAVPLQVPEVPVTV